MIRRSPWTQVLVKRKCSVVLHLAKYGRKTTIGLGAWQGGWDMDSRFPGNVIEGGSVWKHGYGIQFRWDSSMLGEKGTTKGLRGAMEGLTKLLSPLGEKYMLFMVKEFMVGYLERRWGRGIMCEGKAKLLLESFAIFIVSSVHGTIAKNGLTSVLVSRIGVRAQGNFHKISWE